MALASEQLKRAGKDNLADFYNEDEIDLFASYKRHLALSKEIAKAQYHQEAWLELLIAVECLVKDVYCAVRFATWNKKFPTEKFYDRPHFQEASVVKSFGHDLKFLTRHLASVVSDLGSDADFRRFIDALPIGASWVAHRYRHPQSRDPQYKRDFELLTNRLNTVLDGKLRGWK